MLSKTIPSRKSPVWYPVHDIILWPIIVAQISFENWAGHPGAGCMFSYVMVRSPRFWCSMRHGRHFPMPSGQGFVAGPSTVVVVVVVVLFLRPCALHGSYARLKNGTPEATPPATPA